MKTARKFQSLWQFETGKTSLLAFPLVLFDGIQLGMVAALLIDFVKMCLCWPHQQMSVGHRVVVAKHVALVLIGPRND